jgi:hypothetical protein
VLRPDNSTAVRRLSELRAALPGDHTLQNLLGILSAKLELCSKLPVYEYEAASQGHSHCVAAFRRLAESERQSYDDIVHTLRVHLETTTAAKEVAAPKGME